MDSRMHEMELLLQPSPEMDDVRVVGIWGMGGIGKTTTARAVYEKIACQFEACCFLDNVKEEFSACGAVHMQEKLLSRILNEKVQSLDRGYGMILKRLQMKKVLIVLDDVDDLFQIETLLGKQHSFGGGSRIILTARDKLVLSRADAIYSPKVLSGDGALELFSQYAFRTEQPKRDYDHLSSRAVRYAQGLPLALKVLGVLEKLKKIPQRGIHDVLRTSFDGLDASERDIFLDIACFFKGAEKDNATKVLDGCGFYPHTGLRVLIDRALITVSWEKLEMHDLLEEMGREIATEAVESIILDLSFSKPKVVYFSSEAFVKMTKLRLLKVHGDNGYSCENLKFLPHELRSLEWKHFPLKSLPSNFIAKNLPLENLKIINLTSSPRLKKTPDFTEAKNLEKAVFQSCTSLFEVHPSISSLKNLLSKLCLGGTAIKELPASILNLTSLDTLKLNDCRELESLPSSISHMKSLKYLDVSGCSKLEKFPEISEVMKELSILCLGGTAIKELPASILNLTSLVTLNLNDCRELESLPSSISHMKSLKYLDVSGCSKLEKFPEILEVMKNLSELCLGGTAIKELPASILNLTSLVRLRLNNCRELESLPSSISHMKSLAYLDVSGCSKLEKFAEISEVMKELSILCLGGTAIKELPASILNLTSLVTLKLNDCRELESLPSSISHMKSLKYLDQLASILNLTSLDTLKLNDCRELESLPSSFSHMKSLEYCGVSGCSQLENFPEFSELVHMVLEGARPNTGLYGSKEPDSGAPFLRCASFSCPQSREQLCGSFCQA
ncbi:unnamed protein product [Malus baccata var. baccata]